MLDPMVPQPMEQTMGIREYLEGLKSRQACPVHLPYKKTESVDGDLVLDFYYGPLVCFVPRDNLMTFLLYRRVLQCQLVRPSVAMKAHCRL